MRAFLFPMMAISVGLLDLSSLFAQDVVAKKIVVGAITSVDKAAGTFTLDNKGEPLELTIHQNTDGAGEIVKGRRVTVMYGQSLDGDEMLVLRVKPSKGGSKPGSDEDGDEPATSSGKPGAPKFIRATGTGVDADKARQAAFTTAVEQQVGLLVDSDTIVENDEVIRDVVRTFSKGKVDSFKVVKEWQEDELFHATIEATVAVDKLADGLRARRVPINQIDGEKLGRQGDYDRKQTANAAAIVSDDFPTYKLTDYLKAEIADKPKIEGAQTGVATMTVTVKISSDMDKWSKMADQIARVLRRTLPRNGITIAPHSRTVSDGDNVLSVHKPPVVILNAAKTKLMQRGDDWAYLVMVAKGLRDGGPKKTFLWEGFEAPKDAFDKIAGEFEDRRYFLRVSLKDSDGELVQEQEVMLTVRNRYPLLARWNEQSPRPFSSVYIAPYFFLHNPFSRGQCIRNPFDLTESLELSVSTDDLKRVKEVTADVIERTADATP